MCADRLTAPTPPGPAGGGAFGDLLRRSREGQGITLEAVATKTRIAPHHLEALERGDLDALPAGPFGKSYLRAYAEVLGIDPEPILEAYRVQERRRGIGTAEGEQRLLRELSHLVEGSGEGRSRPARRLARPVRLAVAVASVAILGAVGWLLARHGARGSTVDAPPPPTLAPAEGVAQPRPRQAPPSGPGRPVRAAGDERPAAKPPASPPPTDSLRVSAFGVGADVVDRRLVGRTDLFPEGSRVVFWTEVRGGRPGHVIRHVWFREGRAAMRADLAIGGPHWRTHSTLLLPRGSAGPWTVEVRTSDGRLLARNDFTCEPLEPRRPR